MSVPNLLPVPKFTRRSIFSTGSRVPWEHICWNFRKLSLGFPQTFRRNPFADDPILRELPRFRPRKKIFSPHPSPQTPLQPLCAPPRLLSWQTPPPSFASDSSSLCPCPPTQKKKIQNIYLIQSDRQSGPKKPWQPETWQDSTLFLRPEIGQFSPHFGFWGDFLTKLHRKSGETGKIHWRKFKNQVEKLPRNCRFVPCNGRICPEPKS